MERMTIRNICIFIFIATACGWIGLFIDRHMEPQPNGESLGMGIWLVAPLLTTILLRFFAGDGWKDAGFNFNIKRNVQWDISSLFIFPIITTFILLVGKILGWIDFSNFRINTYFIGFASSFLTNFIKNIFEESVWRGYLTAKLVKLKIHDIWLYLIVGGVWGIWHLPYYLYFLPESDINQVLPVGRFEFALIAIFSMMCWSVMFVELYRITKSIWAVVLLHTMEDSLINHMIIDGHIVIASGKEILISPIIGVITSILYLLVGIALRKKRIYKERFLEK